MKPFIIILLLITIIFADNFKFKVVGFEGKTFNVMVDKTIT
jgi:hypothetical protein